MSYGFEYTNIKTLLRKCKGFVGKFTPSDPLGLFDPTGSYRYHGDDNSKWNEGFVFPPIPAKFAEKFQTS